VLPFPSDRKTQKARANPHTFPLLFVFRPVFGPKILLHFLDQFLACPTKGQQGKKNRRTKGLLLLFSLSVLLSSSLHYLNHASAMNQASIFFALLAIVACVAALQQPSIIKEDPLACEGMQEFFFLLYGLYSLLVFFTLL
jgi:hypothetical protein